MLQFHSVLSYMVIMHEGGINARIIRERPRMGTLVRPTTRKWLEVRIDPTLARSDLDAGGMVELNT